MTVTYIVSFSTTRSVLVDITVSVFVIVSRPPSPPSLTGGKEVGSIGIMVRKSKSGMGGPVVGVGTGAGSEGGNGCGSGVGKGSCGLGVVGRG